MTDILEVLFNEKFIQELEDASQLGRHSHVRQLMEDIANVSIMRLDTFSMTKLWELMIMVFKWQITVAKENELFLLTERHLQGVNQFVLNQPIASKIMSYREKVHKLGRETNCKCVVMMRSALVDWLKDFNVRVSLLLRLGLQRNDGSFCIPNNPAERILEIIRKPGDNIYLYENEEGYIQNREQDANTSEVSFIVNDILGHSEGNVKNVGNSYLRFLQNNKSSFESKQGTSVNNCEFEVQLVNMKDRSEFKDIGDKSGESTTLHEDLLRLLDENLLEKE